MSSGFKLHGFKSPNYTSIPDEFFDIVAPNLTEAELRVLIYIMRRTFGFKKDSDNISLRQMVDGIHTKDGRVLDQGTGLSKPSVVRAVKGLIEKEIIVATRRSSAEKGDEPTAYSLLFQNEAVLTKATRGGHPKQHGGVNQSNPQETVLQETDRQQSNDRYVSQSQENVDNSEDQSNPETTETSSLRPVPPGVTKEGKVGFTAVGDVVAQKIFRPRRQPDEARQVITAYVADFSIELGDEAKLSSSISRAVNLFRRSGHDLGEFTSALYEARSRTQEYTANVKKRRASPDGQYAGKNKMAYYFAILEDVLGLREEEGSTAGNGERRRSQTSRLETSSPQTGKFLLDHPDPPK